jgi:hypothetical protein
VRVEDTGQPGSVPPDRFDLSFPLPGACADPVAIIPDRSLVAGNLIVRGDD